MPSIASRSPGRITSCAVVAGTVGVAAAHVVPFADVKMVPLSPTVTNVLAPNAVPRSDVPKMPVRRVQVVPSGDERITLPKPTSAEGVTLVTRWKAEVTDLRALCRAIGEGVVPVECVVPNLVTLNKMAVALKQSLGYPGVRAVAEQGIAARARR